MEKLHLQFPDASIVPTRFSPVGVEVQGVAGTPSWFELHTLDYPAALSFYRDVLQWDLHTMSDEPHFRYSTYGSGDSQRAGIMDAAGNYVEGGTSGDYLNCANWRSQSSNGRGVIVDDAGRVSTEGRCDLYYAVACSAPGR